MTPPNEAYFPKIDSIVTASTEYVLVGECHHTCKRNGYLDSVTVSVGSLNASYALVKFVYGKKVLFNELRLGESVEVYMDFRPQGLLVPINGFVAMYARTSDATKPIQAVGAFNLRERF